jgi:hypothetical protein
MTVIISEKDGEEQNQKKIIDDMRWVAGETDEKKYWTREPAEESRYLNFKEATRGRATAEVSNLDKSRRGYGATLTLPPIKNLSAKTRTPTQLTISWDAVEGANEYLVYCEENSKKGRGELVYVGPDTKTNVGYIMPATGYRFTVIADNTNNTYKNSPEAVITARIEAAEMLNLEKVIDVIDKVVDKVVDAAKDLAPKVVDEVKDAANKVVDVSKDAGNKVVDGGKKAVETTKDAGKKIIGKIKKW